MLPFSQTLTPEKGLIFRITHRDNVPWILENGLHCQSAGIADPDHVSIGNPYTAAIKTELETTCRELGLEVKFVHRTEWYFS